MTRVCRLRRRGGRSSSIEEDFIGIFAFTFPVLFEQEYGRHLMRTQEMTALLIVRAVASAAPKCQSRAMPLLARCWRAPTSCSANHKIDRVHPDQALKSAKESGNQLVGVFAYLWFGTHLTDHGHGQKRDYIRRAFMLAHKLELKALVEHTRKLMEKRNIFIKEAQLAGLDHRVAGEGGTPSNMPSRLFIEHLNHVQATTSELRPTT